MSDRTTGTANLLATYRAGQTFFATRRGMLLGEGVRATLPATDGDQAWATLPARATALVEAAAADGSGAVVAGAIPFERTAAPHLFVPEVVRHNGPVDAEVDRYEPPAATRWQVRHDPPADGYAAAVAEAVSRFGTTPLEKVVLARTVHLTTTPAPDPAGILTALAARDPRGNTFAVPVPGTDPQVPRTFLGASPELLIGRYGDRVVANPYAGSAPRSADPVEDERLGSELLRSAKNLHEHAVVVDDIERLLRPFCRSLSLSPAPELVSTRSMWHLATRIEGVLADPATTALDVACALHPTPAVCGTPTELAYRTIAELEPFDRGYYAGMVGWLDADGDGEWVVAIRSAEVEGDRLRLFAGAGIVDGSVPADEMQETSAKFRTVLDAIGVQADL
ncbi:MAG: isochorismate synthase [Streptosporangiales bacterium]|nr:isochorismate synthase [Streptosporangiales bacterium]